VGAMVSETSVGVSLYLILGLLVVSGVGAMVFEPSVGVSLSLILVLPGVSGPRMKKKVLVYFVGEMQHLRLP